MNISARYKLQHWIITLSQRCPLAVLGQLSQVKSWKRQEARGKVMYSRGDLNIGTNLRNQNTI